MPEIRYMVDRSTGKTVRVEVTDAALAHLRRLRQQEVLELAEKIDPGPAKDEEFDSKVRKELKKRELDMTSYGEIYSELAAAWDERNVKRLAELSADAVLPEEASELSAEELDRRAKAYAEKHDVRYGEAALAVVTEYEGGLR